MKLFQNFLIVFCSIEHSQVFSTTVDYYTSGSYTWVVPSWVSSITITIVGASGGSGRSGNSNGGYGSVLNGVLPVTAGSMLYFYVGGKGGIGANGIAGAAGYNGGGKGGTIAGGGGGGASDIRTSTSYTTRIAVAGGGGGGGANSGGANGGYPVGADSVLETGCSPITAAKGGSQTAGGIAGTCSTSYSATPADSTGVGGNCSATYGGGGGGGYFGGGGGGWGPGGGGCSFC